MTDEDTDFTETIVHECAVCLVACSSVQSCPICAEESKHPSLLCADCRRTCSTCDESVCYDHYSEKAKCCSACQEADYIASGEALYDWKWGGNF